MEKEFIPYEQALALKELGFDEPCLGYYIELRNPQEGILTIEKCENNFDGLLAPTFSQAFRFFREKYDLEYVIDINTNFINNFQPIQKLYKINIIKSNEYSTERHNKLVWSKLNIKTYEEAELECLIKLIELVKKQK